MPISGQLKPLVGILPSPVSKEIRLAGFVNPQFKSGLAVSNPSSTEATDITVRVKDNTGQQPVNEKKVTLAPLECIAGFLNEALFFGAELSNFEGVVEISVNSPPVAALSLIQDAASGDVATVAVLTAIPNIITDTDNTALGVDALSSNTTGIFNTATGASALTSNTEGERNTATGGGALFENTTGNNNTAIGMVALFNNTEGDRNTALGMMRFPRTPPAATTPPLGTGPGSCMKPVITTSISATMVPRLQSQTRSGLATSATFWPKSLVSRSFPSPPGGSRKTSTTWPRRVVP